MFRTSIYFLIKFRASRSLLRIDEAIYRSVGIELTLCEIACSKGEMMNRHASRATLFMICLCVLGENDISVPT